MDSDMISNLPENVTDEILNRLPILDAVRTSVLSTNWRYKWTTITQLVFDDHSLGLPFPNDYNKDKLINFIDRLLLLHSGFIHKFKLFTRCLPIFSSSMIDAWILFLSRKNTIKELVLNFSPRGSGDEYYKLPTCFFFSSQQICTLELHWCVLKPPPATFTGFGNLKSLYLRNITFVDKGVFECIISKCPLLERLTWQCCIFVLDNLNICSPNLKYLRLVGSFHDLCFENTPLLSDVTIHLSNVIVEKFILQRKTGNVVKQVLSYLPNGPNLRKFVMGQVFLEFLSLSKIPKKLPFTWHHLNNLSLCLNFKVVNAICVTLCLLNSSPNLRELTIRCCYPYGKSGHDIENFWEERTLIDWNMSGLQIVKITDIKGFELELEFIKLLLANSPMLEMLNITSGKLDLKSLDGLTKELLTFPRASPKAKINS